MKFLIWLGIPALLIVGIFQAVVELRAEIHSNSAFERIRNFRAQLRAQMRASGVPSSPFFSSNSSSAGDLALNVPAADPKEEDGRLRALQLEEQDVLAAARHASDSIFAPARAHSALGSFLRHLAEARAGGAGSETARSQEQIAFFCEALAAYGKGLVTDPLNARLLMSWANVRQILGPVDCKLPLTQGEFTQAIVQALRLNPTDVESKYAASLLLLWGNAPGEAWKLMREVLRFNTEITEGQRVGIFSQLQNVESLKAIVPPRFPQIASASEYLDAHPLSSGGDKKLQSAFTAALAELQREAVAASVEEYSLDSVPYSVHIERLIRLADYAADDAVRQLLDRELATLVRRRSQFALAEYLSERAALRELESVFATSAGDTRPSKSPLVKWSAQEKFYFDEFYRTVGFFLSDGQVARGVEFSVNSLPNSAFGQSVKVLVSEDNQNWNEITSQVTLRSFELGRRVLVTLRFPPRSSKYWKVHYSSANRERLLLGRIPTGVKVYGVSSSLAVLSQGSPAEDAQKRNASAAFMKRGVR